MLKNTLEYQSIHKNCFLVHCAWDDYSSWTTCTKSCGGGIQVRQRQVSVPAQFGGNACEGGAAEQRICNVQGCPSKCFLIHVMVTH